MENRKINTHTYLKSVATWRVGHSFVVGKLNVFTLHNWTRIGICIIQCTMFLIFNCSLFHVWIIIHLNDFCTGTQGCIKCTVFSFFVGAFFSLTNAHREFSLKRFSYPLYYCWMNLLPVKRFEGQSFYIFFDHYIFLLFHSSHTPTRSVKKWHFRTAYLQGGINGFGCVGDDRRDRDVKKHCYGKFTIADIINALL